MSAASPGPRVSAADEAARANVVLAQRYLTAVAAGATGDALAGFFTDDLVQHEFPNRRVPNGVRRDRTAILEGALRGQTVMSGQSFDVHNIVAVGDDVALELTIVSSRFDRRQTANVGQPCVRPTNFPRSAA